MKKEEKLKRLLEMQNDPELFTEEEIRLLMEDEECRQSGKRFRMEMAGSGFRREPPVGTL